MRLSSPSSPAKTAFEAPVTFRCCMATSERERRPEFGRSFLSLPSFDAPAAEPNGACFDSLKNERTLIGEGIETKVGASFGQEPLPDRGSGSLLGIVMVGCCSQLGEPVVAFPDLPRCWPESMGVAFSQCKVDPWTLSPVARPVPDRFSVTSYSPGLIRDRVSAVCKFRGRSIRLLLMVGGETKNGY
nr:hypothetical protein Iba_chr09aCG13770 [Ipomoea batatas]